MLFEIKLNYKILLVSIAAVIVAAYYVYSMPIPGIPCLHYVFTGEGNSTYAYSISDLPTQSTGTISHAWISETVDGIGYDVNEQDGQITSFSGSSSITYLSHRWIYLSKEDRRCMFKKIETATIANGNTLENTTSIVNCSADEMYPAFSYFRRCVLNLKRVGTQKLALPAGQFNTVAYYDNSTGATYWDAGLPFPVKITYDSETYELSEYDIKPAR
jgi:hypothetical protein